MFSFAAIHKYVHMYVHIYFSPFSHSRCNSSLRRRPSTVIDHPCFPIFHLPFRADTNWLSTVRALAESQRPMRRNATCKRINRFPSVLSLIAIIGTAFLARLQALLLAHLQRVGVFGAEGLLKWQHRLQCNPLEAVCRCQMVNVRSKLQKVRLVVK